MWSVTGHDKAVYLLRQSLNKGAVAHAYLFVGPPHVGKMTLALGLAQALNCQGAEPPCGDCPSCQRIALGGFADVQVIDLSAGQSPDGRPRTEIGIDQIRDMQHLASLPPYEGRHKVFIISGAENLSGEAANCLLKTLEEPVGRVAFILLATSERLLPATVVSRCQRLELRPLGAAEVEKALTARWGVETKKARLLARLCRGCLGWAVQAASDEGLLARRRETMERLIEIGDADYEAGFAYAAELAGQFSRQRGSIQEVLDLWLGWWSDILLVRVGCPDLITNLDFQAQLAHRAGSYGLAEIRAFIDSTERAKEQLRQNANVSLVLELLMLSLPRAERSVST